MAAGDGSGGTYWAHLCGGVQGISRATDCPAALEAPGLHFTDKVGDLRAADFHIATVLQAANRCDSMPLTAVQN